VTGTTTRAVRRARRATWPAPGATRPRWVAVVAAALAVSSVATLPSSSEARRLPFTPLGSVDVSADGGRWVARQSRPLQDRPAGPVEIRDERTGTWTALTDVPAGCTDPTVGGHWLVMRCPGPDPSRPWYPQPRVWDLEAPEHAAVAVRSRLPAGTVPNYDFTGVGRRWIGVRVDDDRDSVTLGMIDWHSGRYIRAPADRRHAVADLDARSGRRELCAPLTRRPWQVDPLGERPRFQDLSYERPYAVEGSGRTFRRIVLRRCGSPRRTVLASCSDTCTPPIIAGGVVAWSDGNRVHALVLRSRRHRTWRLPNTLTAGVWLSMSSRHIYVSTGYDHEWVGRLPPH
jgi:hypothetical protein